METDSGAVPEKPAERVTVAPMSAAGVESAKTAAPVAARLPEGAESWLGRLVAVLVWAPVNRMNGLVAATGRSLLDLPLDSERSILDALEAEVMAMGAAMPNGRTLVMRVLTNLLGGKLLFGAGNHNAKLSVELQNYEGRGTGGVLADAVKKYEDDDLVLVMEGAQILEGPLKALVTTLAGVAGEAGAMEEKKEVEGGAGSRVADVSFFSRAEVGGAVMALVRCGSLRVLPRLGAMDFVKQVLPKIAADQRVQVMRHYGESGVLVEELKGYIGGLRRHHERQGRTAFTVVETGAEVAAGSELTDAVVLKGGKVEAGGKVRRSLVLAGGVVKKKEVAEEMLVGKK